MYYNMKMVKMDLNSNFPLKESYRKLNLYYFEFESKAKCFKAEN